MSTDSTYVLTEADRAMIAEARSAFATDYRYLEEITWAARGEREKDRRRAERAAEREATRKPTPARPVAQKPTPARPKRASAKPSVPCACGAKRFRRGLCARCYRADLTARIDRTCACGRPVEVKPLDLCRTCYSRLYKTGRIEVPAKVSETTCACGQPARYKTGECNPCYQARYRAEVLRPAYAAGQPGTCGCGKPARRAGKCATCADRERRAKITELCKVDGCGQTVHYVRTQECAAHYKRRRRAEAEPTTVEVESRSIEPTTVEVQSGSIEPETTSGSSTRVLPVIIAATLLVVWWIITHLPCDPDHTSDPARR